MHEESDVFITGSANEREDYFISLRYGSNDHSYIVEVQDNITAFVNPLIRENSSSNGFDHIHDYNIDPTDLFGRDVFNIAPILDWDNGDGSIYDSEQGYKFEMRMPDGKPFQIVDSSGNDISNSLDFSLGATSNQPFIITQSFEGRNEIVVNNMNGKVI